MIELPSRRVVIWTLFWEFAKITAVVLGGGYVILSVIEGEFVRKRRWIEQQDFLDMVAVAQTVPGIIACNGSVYLGYRLAGFRGALAALTGSALPPVIAIMLLATGVAMLPADNRWINGAFVGVNAAIVGMIFATAWRLGKKVISGWFEVAMALAITIGMVVFRINPGLLMLGTIPCGMLYVRSKLRLLKKSEAR
ncbi:MAG: chromate transporter [Victivallaceae bacterium]